MYRYAQGPLLAAGFGDVDPPHRLGAIALEVQAFPKHRETARRSRAHHAVDARRFLAAIDLGHPADRQKLRGTRSNEEFLQVLRLRTLAVLTGPKIRSCSRRTLRSAAGQSMLDQSSRAPRPAVGSMRVIV